MGAVNDACDALAGIVASIDGLRCVPYPSDQINPPEAHIFNRATDPRMTLGGSPKRVQQLGLRLFVRRIDPRTAHIQLRDYMDQDGDSSIRAALEDHENWPDDVDYVEVTQIGQPFEATSGDAVYLAVDFDVDVIL
jgi:hypothetical protein